MRFPYPSPVIFDLLSPQKRWPAEQVSEWVISGDIDEGFMSFFYRDPERIIPSGDNMVSPADGSINGIIEIEGTTHVIVALSFWDVHMERSPVSGTVVRVEDHGDTLMEEEGKNLVFLQEKMSPVQKIVHIQSEWGLIKVRLITGFFARRVEIFPEVGDKIDKGDRIGLIHLGSTVVMDVPSHLVPAVKLGDIVVGGETILFKRKDQPLSEEQE